MAFRFLLFYLKNIHFIRISTLLFNFENRQVPLTHSVLRDNSSRVSNFTHRYTYTNKIYMLMGYLLIHYCG